MVTGAWDEQRPSDSAYVPSRSLGRDGERPGPDAGAPGACYDAFMLFNRIMRITRREFPLVVFWLYLGTFVVAFPFVFIFPQVTLLLFGLALASLPFAIITARILTAVQEWTDRRQLRAGRCPMCGLANLEGDREDGWTCGACATAFRASGETIEEHESDEPRVLSAAS